MVAPVIASTTVSLIISSWSPVNSMTNSVTNSIFRTLTSLKPRILASVFGKPWPKIEGSYVHLLSNVALPTCIYWWSHWWWVLRLFSLDIPIIRWDPLDSCPSIDSLWISPSSACVTSTCCLGCPNRIQIPNPELPQNLYFNKCYKYSFLAPARYRWAPMTGCRMLVFQYVCLIQEYCFTCRIKSHNSFSTEWHDVINEWWKILKYICWSHTTPF